VLSTETNNSVGEHLVFKCKGTHLSVRRAIAAKFSSKILKERADRAGLLDNHHSADLPQSNKRQKTMDDSLDHCDEARAKLINMRVIQFIAGCGVAMLITQSPFFIDMLKSLNAIHLIRRMFLKTFSVKESWRARTITLNPRRRRRRSLELKLEVAARHDVSERRKNQNKKSRCASSKYAQYIF
jgi:hypothetical protein